MYKRLSQTALLAIATASLGFVQAPPAAAQSVNQLMNLSCNDLWVARNIEYHDAKYCFKTTRGRREFGNAGCFRNEREARRAMGPVNRGRVDRIRTAERRKGC